MLYRQLTRSQKISIGRSMTLLSNEFLATQQVSPTALSEEELSSLYFFWLLRSAQKGYYWSEMNPSDVLTTSFAEEMKGRLLKKIKGRLQRKEKKI